VIAYLLVLQIRCHLPDLQRLTLPLFLLVPPPKCKIPAGGVRHFQDLKDKSSTANLKHHAIGCFGEDVVNAATAGKKPSPLNSSILLFLLAKVNSLSGIHIVCIQPESLVR